jgi:acylphosphatase
MHIFYSGPVQGVGFRFTVKSVAAGFELVIGESGLEHFIRNEELSWSEATGEFRGFEIVR